MCYRYISNFSKIRHDSMNVSRLSIVMRGISMLLMFKLFRLENLFTLEKMKGMFTLFLFKLPLTCFVPVIFISNLRAFLKAFLSPFSLLFFDRKSRILNPRFCMLGWSSLSLWLSIIDTWDIYTFVLIFFQVPVHLTLAWN